MAESPQWGEPMTALRRLLIAVALLIGVASLLVSPVSGQEMAPVHVLTLSGIINPPAASYVERGISQAEEAGAGAVVLRLDTPGGLDEAMRDMIQAIDNAGVPVIVYVAPQGGRAASAGTYIAMAAHVAAMAPGTTIGSATPIAMSSSGDVQDLPEDLRNKVVNEAVSYIRSHAERHGRNADWAEEAVRAGANLPASAAVEQNVVDLMARDLEELLEAVDGREVELGSGERVTLRTAEAPVRRASMGIVERFLHAIANPNIAFILLGLAMLGIFFELASPGAIFPGVAGGIALLLSFYALGTLDAYWGGILLVVLAFGLFVAEIFTAGHGILGVGGVIALLAGAMLLFSNAPPGISVSPWVLGVTGAILAAFFLFFVRAIVASRRRNLAPMGYSSLVGATGVARTELAPQGVVFVQGERWRAVAAEGRIEEGQEVVVERVDGMTVWVNRKSEGGGAS